MLETLLARIEAIENDPAIRAVVLTGAGGALCSGADIEWMRARVSDTVEANRVHAGRLAELMRRLNGSRNP